MTNEQLAVLLVNIAMQVHNISVQIRLPDAELGKIDRAVMVLFCDLNDQAAGLMGRVGSPFRGG